MNEEKPKDRRIGMGEGILIVLFALVFDLLSLIPFLNIVVVFIAQGLLALFFFFHGVSVFSKKKAVTLAIGTAVELIPFLSMLPALTAQTIVIIFLTQIEDKAGVNIGAANIGLSSKTLMNAPNIQPLSIKKVLSSPNATQTKSNLAQINQISKLKQAPTPIQNQPSFTTNNKEKYINQNNPETYNWKRDYSADHYNLAKKQRYDMARNVLGKTHEEALAMTMEIMDREEKEGKYSADFGAENHFEAFQKLKNKSQQKGSEDNPLAA